MARESVPSTNQMLSHEKLKDHLTREQREPKIKDKSLCRKDLYEYHDYACVPCTRRRAKAFFDDRFPSKLYKILASNKFSQIISWLPHGRSWKIWDVSLFEELVLPVYFERANYSSFLRLVNAWGFRRIKNKSKKKALHHDSYYHELFLRGRPDLLSSMKRLARNAKKNPMDKSAEPDFTKLQALPSLSESGELKPASPSLYHCNEGEADTTLIPRKSYLGGSCHSVDMRQFFQVKQTGKYKGLIERATVSGNHMKLIEPNENTKTIPALSRIIPVSSISSADRLTHINPPLTHLSLLMRSGLKSSSSILGASPLDDQFLQTEKAVGSIPAVFHPRGLGSSRGSSRYGESNNVARRSQREFRIEYNPVSAL